MDEANTSQADDAVMTLVYEGHATLSWGQPPEYMAKSIENAIGDQMSADYYFRGSFGSPLSKALIEFMDYDMNDTKEKYIYRSLLGVDHGMPGEPVVVCCDKATDKPGLYRVGPQGHQRGEAIVLFRAVRNRVILYVYPKSHKLEKHVCRQQASQGKLKAWPLVLDPGNVVIVDSYLCLDWPDKSVGTFVAMVYSRGLARLGIDKDEEEVVPFMR